MRVELSGIGLPTTEFEIDATSDGNLWIEIDGVTIGSLWFDQDAGRVMFGTPFLPESECDWREVSEIRLADVQDEKR